MHPSLLRIAQLEVDRTRKKLPPPVQTAAEECCVLLESLDNALQEDSSLPDDLLGMFDGPNRLDPEPAWPGEMPVIRLFLDRLWEHAGGDERIFRREVRITYLHELGHYLGWDEDDIEALGLA